MPDVTVTITIPDAHVQEVSNATGATTKSEFQDWVRGKIKEAVKSYRINQTAEAEDVKIQMAQEAQQLAIEQANSQEDVTIL